MEPVAPVVCTLTTKALARRTLEWADLHQLALDAHAVRGGATVELSPRHWEAAADLVSREHDCCGSWLDLDLTRRENRLILTATTKNPDGIATIRLMLGLDEPESA